MSMRIYSRAFLAQTKTPLDSSGVFLELGTDYCFGGVVPVAGFFAGAVGAFDAGAAGRCADGALAAGAATPDCVLYASRIACEMFTCSVAQRTAPGCSGFASRMTPMPFARAY